MKFQDFVGKEVLVQLKAGCSWLAVRNDGGLPEVVASENEEGQIGFALMPFVKGKVLEVGEKRILLEYPDREAQTPVYTAISLDDVLAISCVGEKKMVEVVGVS